MDHCYPVGEGGKPCKSHQRRLATESVANLRACSVRACAKPGVASVQAALLSSEKWIVVVRREGMDNPSSTGKADDLARSEGKSPGGAMASREDTTGVGERGMYA